MTNGGRLNAEVLNALGSRGDYIMFGAIYDTVRQVSDLADVTRPEVQKALVGMTKDSHPDSDTWTELEPGKGWRKAVAPDPEPVAGLKTDQMGQTHFENAALDIFRAIVASGEAGGPALVRLASDLDTMIRSASFPELTATVLPDPDNGPDEFDNPATIMTLHCPVCDNDVAPSELYAVDATTRWTATESFEAAFDRAPGEHVGFVAVRYDSSTDFDGVGYYLHNGVNSNHPVSLPEHWTEAAL